MHTHARGFSMIGLLVTMVCIIILFTIGMNAMNQAITGGGSAVSGTVRSVQDEMYLRGIYTGLITAGNDMRDARLPVASLIAQSDDLSLNTTANFYSSLIATNYLSTDILISANEYSPFVERMVGYDFHAHQIRGGVPWDTAFEANLERTSHVSFAHMPHFGERYRRGWLANFDRRSVLIGNRGPKDGVDDPNSYTYGRSGVWGGHIVFGDGSITFTDTFTLPGVTFTKDGTTYADNLYAMEDGPSGADAILSFVREMTPSGPTLQHD